MNELLPGRVSQELCDPSPKQNAGDIDSCPFHRALRRDAEKSLEWLLEVHSIWCIAHSSSLVPTCLDHEGSLHSCSFEVECEN